MHSYREFLIAPDIRPSAVPQAVRFSPRGKEVLDLFMRGVTYKEIAEQLGISLSGVRRHREKMLWQNECKSMLELIAKYQAWLAETAPDGTVYKEEDTLCEYRHFEER